jgi:hypothetical protein
MWIHRLCFGFLSGLNEAESSQSVDNSHDQSLNDLISGIPDVPITTLTTNIGCQLIEPASDGLDFVMNPVGRQNCLLEPVVQVIGHHFDQQKQLVAFLVTLAVLVKSKSFLELIDLVFDVAALIVFVEDLGGAEILDVGDCRCALHLAAESSGNCQTARRQCLPRLAE